MRPFEFIVIVVGLLALVLSINVIYRRNEPTTSHVRGLLAVAARARHLEIVSLRHSLEAFGKTAALTVRVKFVFDFDCEDNYLKNHIASDARFSVCVSGATDHVSIERLREKLTGADRNRVLLGDAYLDSRLDIRVPDDVARARLMERKEKLTQTLSVLMNRSDAGEKWLQVRDGTVESRSRQSATSWTAKQVLGLIDATVTIAELISADTS